jgi:hypothetical protein
MSNSEPRVMVRRRIPCMWELYKFRFGEKPFAQGTPRFTSFQIALEVSSDPVLPQLGILGFVLPINGNIRVGVLPENRFHCGGKDAMVHALKFD